MKRMLSFVGKRDPIPAGKKGEGEGAVVTLAKYLKPDTIILFATYDPEKNKENSVLQNLEDTVEWLDTEGIIKKEKIITYRLPMPDPRNYRENMKGVKENWEKYYDNISHDLEIKTYINLSSGTGQQKASWLLLSDSGLFPDCHLMEVSNPQYAKNIEERIEEVHPTFLRENNIINEAGEYLSRYAFGITHSKLNELIKVTPYSDRKEKSRFYSRLCEGYKYWDHIKYKRAYETLQPLYSEYRHMDKMDTAVEILKTQVDILKELRKEEKKETVLNLIDLHFNSLRCYQRENYTNVLARFWRLTEGFYYYNLRKKYGIEPTNIYKSDNTNNRKMISHLANNNGELSLSRAYKVLKEEFQDKNFLNLLEEKVEIRRGPTPEDASLSQVKIEKLIGDLRDLRNKSISAHGMRPVSWDDADSALRCSKTLMKKLDSHWFQKEVYPFSPVIIKEISKSLKNL